MSKRIVVRIDPTERLTYWRERVADLIINVNEWKARFNTPAHVPGALVRCMTNLSMAEGQASFWQAKQG